MVHRRVVSGRARQAAMVEPVYRLTEGLTLNPAQAAKPR
jgi:hypothetical protein